jgi:acyl-CoA reductase-like NAD-dependent aldehyde dehydrogenase
MQAVTIDGQAVAGQRSFDVTDPVAGAVTLECGTAFVNTHAELPPTIPFGGSKWSGLGHENGTAGLLAFTEHQVVHLKKAGN